MARIGAFCFPGTGHINPMTALARRLRERGHEFVLFGIADCEARVKATGTEFCRIGEADYPLGTLPALDKRLGELKGLATFKFTVERVKNTARMVLRDGPAAVQRARVDVLLVDEADMGGTVAEHLGLPFVSIAFFPPLVHGSRIPSFCFGWAGGQDLLSRLRNWLGMRLLLQVAAPIYAVVNRQRKIWGLKRLKRPTDALSPLAQIAQLPRILEFENSRQPSFLHYTGPLIDARSRTPIDFPWDRLDGRPLIYASLGTLQNGAEEIFRTIAAACTGLDAQLVISLGGGIAPERLGSLPGNPLVVAYAPQLEIVKRAALVVTHAGLNTVLESLAEGVPLVCMPLGNDQPGVAARVAARGAGVVVSRRGLTAPRLRTAIRAVLEDEKCRCAAREVQTAMAQADGLELAANVIEDVIRAALKIRMPVQHESSEILPAM